MTALGTEVHRERNAAIITARLEGAQIDSIAARAGVTPKVVSHVLQKAGVVDRPHADPETKARAVRMAARLGAVETAERLRVSVSSVRRWVRQAKEAARG